MKKNIKKAVIVVCIIAVCSAILAWGYPNKVNHDNEKAMLAAENDVRNQYKIIDQDLIDMSNAWYALGDKNANINGNVIKSYASIVNDRATLESLIAAISTDWKWFKVYSDHKPDANGDATLQKLINDVKAIGDKEDAYVESYKKYSDYFDAHEDFLKKLGNRKHAPVEKWDETELAK